MNENPKKRSMSEIDEKRANAKENAELEEAADRASAIILANRIAREENLRWQEQKKRADVNALKRASSKLISLWELAKLWVSLQPDESLVLGYDGSIHRGRVKTEKLNALAERFTAEGRSTVRPGFEDGDFDEGARETAVRTNWFVGAPSAIFKSSWNNSVRLYRYREMPGVFELFVDALEEYLSVNPEENSQYLTYNITQNSIGAVRYELSMPDFPYTCAVNEHGKCVYYIFKGVQYDLD